LSVCAARESASPGEMLVLDANILIRAVLGRRVRQLLECYEGRGTRFFAPDRSFHEAEEYLPSILQQRGRSEADAAPTLAYLREIIDVVPYETYAAFEEEARERLRTRDEDDWPVLASALAIQAPI